MYDWEIDVKLDELIAEAYVLFSNYKLGNRLNVCECCVSNSEAESLARTPLSMVSSELLQNSYYESADSDTEQELIEMKHFLPRVLSLMLNNEFPCHSNELIFSRINLKQSKRWKEEELEFLKKFSMLYFKKTLKDTYADVQEVLIIFELGGFDLSPLLTIWEQEKDENSLLHLYDILNTGVTYRWGKIVKLTNAFSTKSMNKSFIAWIENEKTRTIFLEQIEEILLDEESNLDDETWFQLDLLYGLLSGYSDK